MTVPFDGARFCSALLGWYEDCGRKDLPWRQTTDPYRLWVAEVMLQQTQVAVVVPYYQKFLARFPDVASLATAPLDDVLALWSGLGYYRRARYLYQAAGVIARKHSGHFPRDIAEVLALPGVGKSTAGAILSAAGVASFPILEANARRVLMRLHGRALTESALWHVAEALTPATDGNAFNQAIQDLGAVVCASRAPQCSVCPVTDLCAAHRLGVQGDLPPRKVAAVKPTRHGVFVVVRDNQGQVLLERMAAGSVWPDLWVFPFIFVDAEEDVKPVAHQWCVRREVAVAGMDAPMHHVFSHFRLQYRVAHGRREGDMVGEERAGEMWCAVHNAMHLGIPRPVARILETLGKEEGENVSRRRTPKRRISRQR